MRDGLQNETISDRAGFTLIEMLVTLCVVSLLGVALAGGLSHLARIRAITQTVSAEQELDATMTYLHDLIGSSLALPLLDQSPPKAPMIGEASRLLFVADARVSSDRRVLRDVELILRSDAGAKTLIERHAARRASGERSEGEFPILSGIASLTFSYLDPSADAEVDWETAWQSDRLPRAVDIHIEVIREGGKISRECVVFLNSSR